MTKGYLRPITLTFCQKYTLTKKCLIKPESGYSGGYTVSI